VSKGKIGLLVGDFPRASSVISYEKEMHYSLIWLIYAENSEIITYVS